jgi:hypothetical protein
MKTMQLESHDEAYHPLKNWHKIDNKKNRIKHSLVSWPISKYYTETRESRWKHNKPQSL